MKLSSLSVRLLALGALAFGTPFTVRAQTAADALRFAERSAAIGPRAIGLAGATGAGLADPSALFTNPAEPRPKQDG